MCVLWLWSHRSKRYTLLAIRFALRHRRHSSDVALEAAESGLWRRANRTAYSEYHIQYSPMWLQPNDIFVWAYFCMFCVQFNFTTLKVVARNICRGTDFRKMEGGGYPLEIHQFLLPTCIVNCIMVILIILLDLVTFSPYLLSIFFSISAFLDCHASSPCTPPLFLPTQASITRLCNPTAGPRAPYSELVSQQYSGWPGITLVTDAKWQFLPATLQTVIKYIKLK